MTSHYHIEGPISGAEYPEESLFEGPIHNEFVVTATSEDAALEKHQTHCEELGIELDEISVTVLDEYLDGGEHLLGVEDPIWKPGDSVKEVRRYKQVEDLQYGFIEILLTIYWMNRNDDHPVSIDRIAKEYASEEDHELDPSTVIDIFGLLIRGRFVEAKQEDGVTVYSLSPARARELRREKLKQAYLFGWSGRNPTKETG